MPAKTGIVLGAEAVGEVGPGCGAGRRLDGVDEAGRVDGEEVGVARRLRARDRDARGGEQAEVAHELQRELEAQRRHRVRGPKS